MVRANGTSSEFSLAVGCKPDSNEVSAEAEESPLSEAITRERTVKT
jgi:hypothetical protein